MASPTSGGTEQMLPRERAKASFDVRALTHVLAGGAEKTARKEELVKLVETDPIFDNKDIYYLTRTEYMEKAFAVQIHMKKRALELGLKPSEFRIWNDLMPISLGPLSLQYTMFLVTMSNQTTPEQKAYWLPLILSDAIVGAYAQTELGHGSNVRGLEVTATYDKTTQEFVINSPTLTSLKWWNGGLGVTATHCVCSARLILEGVDKGIHQFIVPVRDPLTHKPYSGIEVGDIGPKMGWNAIDNCFCRFTKLRIPRANMLARYSQVSADGTYSRRGNPKSGYGTMIFVRAGMVAGAGYDLAKAVTIATRYSAVRHQGFKPGSSQQEMCVLDYLNQQYALFPLLATAYCYQFTAMYMLDKYERLQANLDKEDASELPEVHATSSGLKAVCTWTTAAGIEECRLRCGGHGYMLASGLPSLFCDYVVMETGEGDNVILCLQTARFVLKQYQAVLDGRAAELSGVCEYLKEVNSLNQRCGARSTADLDSAAAQLDLYKYRVAHMTKYMGEGVFASMRQGMSLQEAMQAHAIDMVKLAKAHCAFALVRNFQNHIEQLPSELKPVVSRLRSLYALYNIEQDSSYWLKTGYLDGAQLSLIEQRVRSLLGEIRPDAVALVDAFNIPDCVLNSAIGRKDGKVYEALYEFAKRNPINKQWPPVGYTEHLRPLLDRGQRLTGFPHKYKKTPSKL